MRLTMVGSGYVGLVTGACLANTGNDVICLDVDADKIARLRRGEPTIYEPGLANMIERNTKANRLSFTSDAAEAYRDAEIIFISVGTPTGADGAPDLSYVLSAADEIAVAIEAQPAGSAPKLVVVKSTVPVGTTHRVRDRIREHTNKPFLIANNPEFLKEGAAISDFIKPDRVVCGVEEDFAAEILRDLYNPFVLQGNPILVMDIRSSEMVKYASNAMLACKISFINEIANLCEHYDADVRSVREGMCADHRIGNQFLFPGLGYGGSCFPKDTLAVIDMGRNAGCDCALNTAVHDVNQRQRDRFWSKIAGHFGGEMAGKRLAFWGIAFKPQTDDIREAPAVDLMERALAAGAEVRAFDPAAAAVLAKRLPAVVTCDSMYDTVDGADALVVCTEWSEFRHP
ncbi:MAG: UDP-glucose/GDP-mannose dehydrogenase family protein, partial [Planctomycetes bacterium]|nr:UDP-glucose/GDP-mannose dehydrogenase family protein [Planctomycetota bacterium]